MVSSPRPSRLTPLQRELLDAFFARESRMFLTGGAALAGFYFGHRETEDLVLFGPASVDLDDVEHSLQDAAIACNARLAALSRHGDFRRNLAVRGEERCVVDLVRDRVPMLEPEKPSFGVIRVDPLREIAANKISALIGRSEIKDLVDLSELLGTGLDLERAVEDAEQKDASADPATLAWVLSELSIAADARLPGGSDVAALTALRDQLVEQLRALAFRRANPSTG